MKNITRDHLYLIGGVAIVVLIIVSAFFVNKKVSHQEVTIDEGGVGASIVGDGEIDQIPVDTTLPTVADVPQPNLSRSLTFPQGFSQDAIAIITKNIETLTTQLEADSSSFQAWMDLGKQYKIVEDYEGAREVWEYLSKVSSSPTVHSNLGNLFALDLQDFSQAELHYKKAIELDNTELSAYVGLHELYRYSYKTDTDLAERTLLDGLKISTHNIDLLVMLAGYYKDMNRMAEAKSRYLEARNEAEKEGNTSLVEQLDQEIAAL